MIASLPMYDRPSTAEANDRLWAEIRGQLAARGVAAPECLTRDGDPWDHWLVPELVLSQTCGLPYRTRLHGSVALVGTPDYGLDDCPPGHYRSRVLVRADDPRARLSDFAGARLAYNESMSQSGWAALAVHAPGMHWGALVRTGGHARSVEAVASGAADIAAIDAVTWELLRAEGAPAEGLRVLASTEATPGLPLISALGADVRRIREAVAEAISRLDPADTVALRLTGLVAIPAEDYLRLPIPPGPERSAQSE